MSGDAGTADQTIVIQQDGGKITGTFKGPRQSATINGTVDGNAVKKRSVQALLKDRYLQFPYRALSSQTIVGKRVADR